jgi:osmotically inducible lipoprotein OsmE
VHYIVMDFEGKDDALVDRQRAAMERLAATWQDYEGTFPTR